MKTRPLGRSGLQVSEIALGSWLTFGSAVDAAATGDLTRAAYDMGINFFDTADVYANGVAEEVLGEALREIPRHTCVIATKCFFPMSAHPNDGGLSRKHITESVEASLRRLQTDYLDLHQCHRMDKNVPLEETVRAYEDLIRGGKLLYWGVSEWSANHIQSACEIAKQTLGYRPISNQPNYSIMRRQIEAKVLPACREEGLGQVVFSPLGQGVLTGKYTGGSLPSGSRGDDQERNRWMGAYLEPDALERVDRLRPIADSLGISMAQLALAWCLRNPGVSSVIVGVTRLSQLQDNCAAAGLTLSDDVCEQIDEIFPAPDGND